jgi:hypothetical protein
LSGLSELGQIPANYFLLLFFAIYRGIAGVFRDLRDIFVTDATINLKTTKFCLYPLTGTESDRPKSRWPTGYVNFPDFPDRDFWRE